METGEERLIEQLFEALGLGTLSEKAAPVHGGLLHRMYRVVCRSGIYAVKHLNPEIMRRPEALRNMINGERIAEAFRESAAAVPALCLRERQIHELEGAWFAVYPWVEGKSVYCPEITPGHCAVIGSTLGKIHRAAVRLDGVCPDEAEGSIPWPQPSGEDDKEGEPSWLSRYRAALPDLMEWDRQVQNAAILLREETVISHRDLDPKNVLWNGMALRVIDWEAAGYVNPWQELLEVVGYWAADGAGELIPACAEALIDAYGRYRDLHRMPWEAAYAGARAGMLGWLAWQAELALRPDTGPADREAAARQITGTLDALYGYERRLEQVYHMISGQGARI